MSLSSVHLQIRFNPSVMKFNISNSTASVTLRSPFLMGSKFSRTNLGAETQYTHSRQPGWLFYSRGKYVCDTNEQFKSYETRKFFSPLSFSPICWYMLHLDDCNCALVLNDHFGTGGIQYLWKLYLWFRPNGGEYETILLSIFNP